MPQMAPMNWLFLFTLFTLIFLLFNTLNYYNFYYAPKNSQKKINKMSLAWKW